MPEALLISLLLGGYLYTTGVFTFLFRWIERKFDKWESNHFKHAEKAINETRERVGLPPVLLREDD
jgi:hypothetical protein